VAHPALVTAAHLEILDDRFHGAPVEELFGYSPGWGMPRGEEQAEIARIMAELTSPEAARA
jgi:hypothetical protein